MVADDAEEADEAGDAVETLADGRNTADADLGVEAEAEDAGGRVEGDGRVDS